MVFSKEHEPLLRRLKQFSFMGESDDITIDKIIDEIVKEVPNRKVKGRLNNHRVYLAGPIDHADDDGVAWRQKLTPYLKKMGLTILDPTDKPVSQCDTMKSVMKKSIFTN